jgi:nucleotide-binding universal stress UspA family protein
MIVQGAAMTGFRTLVVDGSPRGGLRATFAFARAMAKAYDAHLAVASYAWPRLSFRNVLVHNALLEAEQTGAMKRALAASRSVFDEVLATDEGRAEWHAGIGEPAIGMGAHALAADLLVMDSSEDRTCVRANAAQMAIDYGVPVLRLGTSPVEPAFANVVVAWKDSPQARRAAHDALPILVRASHVTVAGVGDEVAAKRLDAVAAHLGRHGVASHARHVPDTAGDVGLALVEQARRDGATLIVSGAFGRPPIAERVLGGVTTSLLARTEMCWFMSN